MKRLLALAMACGFVFATSLGSLHDPRCPHHLGGAPEAHSASEHVHDHAPTQELPEDCTCDGGLCVPAVVSGPPVQTAAEISFGETKAAEPLLVDREVTPTAVAERYLQPPGTGPPTVV